MVRVERDGSSQDGASGMITYFIHLLFTCIFVSKSKRKESVIISGVWDYWDFNFSICMFMNSLNISNRVLLF